MSNLKLEAPVGPSSLREPARSLKLLPLSDLHLTASPTATQKIVSNRDYFTQMDHVVLLGDMVGNYGTDSEYAALQQFVGGLEQPYSAINGNHEFYFRVYHENSEDYRRLWKEGSLGEKVSQLEKFKSFFGIEQLWRMERNELGAFIFLGLDGVEFTKPETLSALQLLFLENALHETRDVPTYVFCHAPLYLDRRLDMTYYDNERTACVELEGKIFEQMTSRRAPLFWMSGHIHLRPDHYLFSPYELKENVWQIHCPDSWGYSRWAREHLIPQRHEGLFSRHLEIESGQVTFVAHDHHTQADIARETIKF